MKKPTKPKTSKKWRWSKEKRDRVFRENEQILTVLQAIYPETFDVKRPKPLAVGIHNSIKESLPDASKNMIDRFLKWWTNKPNYHYAVSKSDKRYALDGSESGVVEPKHEEHSKRRIEAHRRPSKPKKGKKGKVNRHPVKK